MGVVQDTTGDVIFSIKFDIIAFKPEKGKILDGVVESVHDRHIMIRSGPLTSICTEYVSIIC